MDNKLKTVDAETLLSTPMSKTMFIVDGLISQGVNVISGASKIADTGGNTHEKGIEHCSGARASLRHLRSMRRQRNLFHKLCL